MAVRNHWQEPGGKEKGEQTDAKTHAKVAAEQDKIKRKEVEKLKQLITDMEAGTNLDVKTLIVALENAFN